MEASHKEMNKVKSEEMDEEGYQEIKSNIEHQLCSGCLCTGRKVHALENDMLQLYITNLNSGGGQFNYNITKEKEPPQVCWECSFILHKVVRFKQRVTEAYNAITQGYHTESAHPPRLTTVTASHIDIQPQCTEHCEPEMEQSIKLEITCELESIELEWCTACLNVDRKLQNIRCDMLRQYYEDILSQKQDATNTASICWECMAVLKTAVRFQNQLKQSYSVLHQSLSTWMIQGSSGRPRLSRSVVETTDIQPSDEVTRSLVTSPVKQEHPSDPDEPPDQEVTVKVEINKDVEEYFQCNQCTSTFTEKSAFDVHTKRHKEKRFKCMLCKKRFARKQLFNNHILSHSGVKTYDCEQCTKSFYKKDDLDRHIFRKHLEEDKPYKCTLCAKAFSELMEFNLHVSQHIKEKPFLCTHCPWAFSRNVDLDVHLRTHSDEGPYQCKTCFKRFAVKAVLDNHEAIHASKIYGCGYCHKKFLYKLTVQNHIKLCHTPKGNEKSYPCDKCHIVFNHPSYLNIHVAKLHSEGKPFQCSQCSWTFSRSEELDQHIKTHSANYRHLRPQCPKAYKQKGELNLNIHMRHHTEVTSFQCAECPKAFIKKSQLNLHMTIHTGETRYECNECSKEFLLKCKLKQHLKTHSDEKPFSCTYCTKAFRQRGQLNTHLRTHKGTYGSFRCPCCSWSFAQKGNLAIHLRTHTGEIPYQCEQCLTRFSQKATYDSHMKTHTVSLQPVFKGVRSKTIFR